MSNLYIKVENGQPVGHPMLADTVRGLLETSTLSEGFARENGYYPFRTVPLPDTQEVVEDNGYEVCDDGWVQPSIVVRDLTLEERRDRFIRPARDFYLAKSDWTQTVDAPLSAEKRAEWAAYRQALRDIPATFPDAERPDQIVWPTTPAK